MACVWVVRFFLGFAAFCSLRRPVSRHIAFLPQCRMGAVCPPVFCLASLRRHKTRQLLGANAKTVAPRGTSVLSDPGSSASGAMLSSLPSTPPPASSFLSPRFIPLFRLSFDPTSGSYGGALTRQSTFSRLPAFLQRPDCPGPPDTSSSEPPELPTSRFLNLLISQPPKSQPVESGSALRASLPRRRFRCESLVRLGASLPP